MISLDIWWTWYINKHTIILINIYAHVMYMNEVLIFYRTHKNSNRELIYIAYKSFKPN
jgi:hypothetical protein